MTCHKCQDTGKYRKVGTWKEEDCIHVPCPIHLEQHLISDGDYFKCVENGVVVVSIPKDVLKNE